MESNIYIEFSMVFDNDFNVEQISDILGIVSNDYKNKNSTRYNAISKKNNPGYWTICSEKYYNNLDVEYPIENILEKIKNKIVEIKKICCRNDGEIYFDIVVYFSEKEVPIINLERDFLKIVDYLDAEIRFDMYRI